MKKPTSGLTAIRNLQNSAKKPSKLKSFLGIKPKALGAKYLKDISPVIDSIIKHKIKNKRVSILLSEKTDSSLKVLKLKKYFLDVSNKDPILARENIVSEIHSLQAEYSKEVKVLKKYTSKKAVFESVEQDLSKAYSYVINVLDSVISVLPKENKRR
jgi:hypothetical protein